MVLTGFEEYKARICQIKTDNILFWNLFSNQIFASNVPMVGSNESVQGAGFRLCFIRNQNFSFISNQLADVAQNPVA